MAGGGSIPKVRMLGALMALLLVASTVMDGAEAKLSVEYYRKSCPSAESIIQKAVAAQFKKNKNTAAGLIRMHFHDCFVNGCDGSVLIDSKDGNTAEKDGPGNANSLRGFEAIDNAKAQLEAVCPGVVSCADILTYAARDSTALVGGPSWPVEAGRRDGLRSSGSDTRGNLPPPSFTVDQLTENFQSKGLSQDEMVTLSGAHTIGQAHCATFAGRINASNPDPTLDAKLAKKLAQQCPAPAPASTLVNMEITPTKFDNRYYSELLRNKGLFTSDQVLASSPATRPAVVNNANNQAVFFNKFAKAMVHMGQIGVLTGSQGEIRRNCRVFN